MHADDELCLCFHVSWRKVINYIRINKVRLPSQIAECQSAGTGCGWCRSAMRRLVEQIGDTPPQSDDLQRWLEEEYPASSDYRAARKQYIADGRGNSPRP